MPEQDLNFFDWLSIFSCMLGYENLMENREQSWQNDVSAANDAQAKFLLQQLDRRFDAQNEMLRNIEARLKALEQKLN